MTYNAWPKINEKEKEKESHEPSTSIEDDGSWLSLWALMMHWTVLKPILVVSAIPLVFFARYRAIIEKVMAAACRKALKVQPRPQYHLMICVPAVSGQHRAQLPRWLFSKLSRSHVCVSVLSYLFRIANKTYFIYIHTYIHTYIHIYIYILLKSSVCWFASLPTIV